MAKVKVSVLERDGAELGFPEEIKPDSDYLSAKGINFENSDNHKVDLSDNEITFTDPVNSTKKVSEFLTEPKHKIVDQFVHRIAENCYHEVTRSNGKRTNETWWDSSEKTKKIREINYTRTSNRLSVIEYKQYDSSGVLSETYTETLTRDGDNRYQSSIGVLS